MCDVQKLPEVGMCHARSTISEGDVVIVYVCYGQMHEITVARGHTLAMKRGALRHEFLIGKKYGQAVEATAGFVTPMRPTPELWSRCLPHHTQIIYTPDAAAIIMNMDIGAGSRVAESGTGSGSLSHALCRAVQPNGHLYTFDIDKVRIDSVRAAIHRHGFGGVATLSLRNVCEQGFGDIGKVTAVFLDLPTPWLAIEHAVAAFDATKACRIATFSPCIEQVQQTCAELSRRDFVNVETVELVGETYKLTGREEQLGIYPRTQPTHTSFLTFATLSPMH